MTERITPDQQQPFKVQVEPSVIRKVDEIITGIQRKAIEKGDRALWLWADRLNDEFAQAIIRLHQGDIGNTPTNYPEFDAAGYRRLIIHEYWNLFYLVRSDVIQVQYFIDGREDQKKYKPIKKHGYLNS
jgi:hypothetical protein